MFTSRQGPQWFRLYSTNFEFVGDIGSRHLLGLLTDLENADAALMSVPFTSATVDRPVHVFALGSRREYVLSNADPLATAFNVRFQSGYYIVLGPEAVQRVPLVHEYAHIVLHQKYGHLPMWLEEGLADYYSTIERKRGVVVVGTPLEGRLELLRSSGISIPLRTLFSSHRENVRSDPTNDLFYAESWLLVVMLMRAPKYAPRFGEIVEQLNRGRNIEQLLLQFWGKSPEAIENALKCYLKLNRLPIERLPTANSPSDDVQLYLTPLSDEPNPLHNLLVLLNRVQ
jgi:hypothetical protein